MASTTPHRTNVRFLTSFAFLSLLLSAAWPLAAQQAAVAADEAGLLHQAEAFEARIASRASRVRDPVLDSYLRELVCKIDAQRCTDVRIYVIREPYFNALMAPNGAMVLFTGLLLRMEDEAQLVFVLGHELSHLRSRDSLAGWRRLKAAGNASIALQIVGGAVGGSALAAVAGLGALAPAFAFSRDQERAADDYGLQRLAELGYDTHRAGQSWADIWREEQARERKLSSGIFATHPASEERAKRLKAAATSGGETRSEAFHAVIAPHRLDWLEDEVGRRHYGQTKVLLERLRRLPFAPAEIDYAIGEMYRRRAREGDLERAQEHYETSTSAPDAPARAWRGLGLSAARRGDRTVAAKALNRYLELAPHAPDRDLIEMELEDQSAAP